MAEIRKVCFSREDIKKIIASKAWYGLDPQTGAFDWNLSLNNLSQSLQIEIGVLANIIEESFDHSCLISVEIEQDGERKHVSLLEAVSSLGLNPHIWTVGDPAWQRKKFERVGANRWVSDDHYHPSVLNKEQLLEETIKEANKQGKKFFVVVDDKWDNISKIKTLSQKLYQEGIVIFDYHFKKNDPLANGGAFLSWLQELKQNCPELEVFLDFDGVVADTDGVLFGPVVDKIFTLLIEEEQ